MEDRLQITHNGPRWYSFPELFEESQSALSQIITIRNHFASGLCSYCQSLIEAVGGTGGSDRPPAVPNTPTHSRHDLEHICHGLGLPIFATQRLIKEFQGSSHCRQYIIPMCWLQANKNVSCKPFWDKPSQTGAYIPLVTQPVFPSRGSIWLEVPGVRHPD